MVTDGDPERQRHWTVERFDEERVPRLLESCGAAAQGAHAAALLERLIALLDERGVLSRGSLGEDPMDWTPGATRRLWRLVEPEAIWRARARGSEVEMIVVRGHGDVLLLAQPGTADSALEAAQLLSGYVSASKSEPYARADSALKMAMHDLDGPRVELGYRQPLPFDVMFRERPEEALFDLGFALDPEPARRCLARLLHVYDLVEDFLDRPLPRHDPIAYGELIALWSPAAERAEADRPTILILMSIDDEPTQRLLPHLERAADGAGYTLVAVFALSRWARRDLAPEALSEQLEREWSRAAGRVAGLVVHYGAAFSTSPSEYRAVLTAFRRKHPEVPLASEALLGERGGELHGIAFDQPPELDFVLEQLGF